MNICVYMYITSLSLSADPGGVLDCPILNLVGPQIQTE